MPSLTMFYGVIIRMYKRDHMPPHIHAEYQDDEACFDFDGNVIEGKLPPNKKKLVVAWISLHKDELAANWKLLQDGEKVCKIDPLK